jgi:hypothetical protein
LVLRREKYRSLERQEGRRLRFALKGSLEPSDRLTEALAELREPRRTEHEESDTEEQE